MARSTKGLYKRGNVWWMTYRDGLGVQQFESCKTRKKGEAEGKLTDRRKEALEGLEPTPRIKPVGLETHLDEYLKFVRNQAGVRTKRHHVATIKRILGNPPLHGLTIKELETYKETRRAEKAKPATINRELATLKHAMTKAVAWNLVRKHVRESLKEVSKEIEPPGRIRYLSGPEEAETLIRACRGPLRAIVLTALHTGMRRGEILKLPWERVDLKKGNIRVTKTKTSKDRTIPMNDTLRGVLTGLRTRIDVPWVFHDEEGKKFRDPHKKFYWACRRAKIEDFRFHDLRHTFASWLVMAGVPLATVSELLGHKSITMTMRYAHLSPQHLTQAVKSLDKNLTIGGFQAQTEGKLAAN